jgi:tetratricopeptide (TPR) repeat protein
MRIVFVISFFFIGHAYAQQPSIEQWNEEAKTNKRLQLKYGTVPKTESETKADKEFIAFALKSSPTRRKASDELIKLGFHYLYRDLKTAMSRFNQAYLLDSTNTDIYWGYGGVYMVLGDLERAKGLYVQGLSINPKNTHLLTDYGTYFMMQSANLAVVSVKDSKANLDSAITYLKKSFELDPKNQNTSYKLSACFFNKDDCKLAVQFYNACRALGGDPIVPEYTEALKKRCKL